MSARCITIIVCLALLTTSIAFAWPDDPLANVPVSTVPGEKADVYLVSDSHNGALIVWEDKRDGDWDIYLQRLNQDGIPIWTQDGVSVCSADDHQNIYHSDTTIPGQTAGVSVFTDDLIET